MATHPSILAWRIPWAEEPDGLLFTGSQRAGHDWVTEHRCFYFFMLLHIQWTDVEAETPILWHLMQRVDSFEKTLMLGGIGGRRRRGWQRMRWLDGITDQWTWVWVNSGSWWWTGRPGVLWFMGSQRIRHNWVTELNWYNVNTKFKSSVLVSFSLERSSNFWQMVVINLHCK